MLEKKKGQKGKRRKAKGVRLAEGVEEERFLMKKDGEEPQEDNAFSFHLIFKCHAFSCKKSTHTIKLECEVFPRFRWDTKDRPQKNEFTNPQEKMKGLKRVPLSQKEQIQMQPE